MRSLLLACALVSAGLLTAGCGSSGSSSSSVTATTAATVPTGRIGNAAEPWHCPVRYRSQHILGTSARWGICPPNDLPVLEDWLRAERPKGMVFVYWGSVTRGDASVLVQASCPTGTREDWGSTYAAWGKDAGVVSTTPEKRIPQIHPGRSSRTEALLDSPVSLANPTEAQLWVRCRAT